MYSHPFLCFLLSPRSFWQQANLYVFIFGALGIELVVLTLCAAAGQLLRADADAPAPAPVPKASRGAVSTNLITRIWPISELRACDPGVPQPTLPSAPQGSGASAPALASMQGSRSRASRVSRALLSATVLVFCWWHAWRHWPRMDHAENDVLLRIAEETFATIPKVSPQ